MVTDKEELANLAANLRAAMVRNRWDQLDLEKASGVPQPTISRVLNGKNDPALSVVTRLAKALKTSIDALVSPPPRKNFRNAS